MRFQRRLALRSSFSDFRGFRFLLLRDEEAIVISPLRRPKFDDFNLGLLNFKPLISVMPVVWRLRSVRILAIRDSISKTNN
jgi:hypothetical protein